MSTREFIRTIRNKIRFLAGITRSKIDAGKDTIGDLHNFQMDEGSLILREGTKVMNSQEDQLWYDIQSFTISGTKILIGLNYKRELWAWLDKWPEIDFKLCTSSPYKRYRHVDENGTEFFNRHISFSRGDNFWLDQDAYTIIIMSDQGEIYKIMKQGFVRITKDLDYVEEKLDQPISTLVTESREYNFHVGRIYVDIKDATNRVFDGKVYLVEDHKKKGHRIKGEVRAAWVNELGVVSELGEPEFLPEYKHVLASLTPVVTKESFGIKSGRIYQPSPTTVATSGSRIHKGSYVDGEFITERLGASDVYNEEYNSDWSQSNAFATILFMPTGGEYVLDFTSEPVSIPAGVYMTLGRRWGMETAVLLSESAEIGSFIKINGYMENGRTQSFNTQVKAKGVLGSIPRFFAEAGGADISVMFSEEWSAKAQTFSIWNMSTVNTAASEWIQLDDRMLDKVKLIKHHQLNGGGTFAEPYPIIRFNGTLAFANIRMVYLTATDRWSFDVENMIAYEFPDLSSRYDAVFCDPFDLWRFSDRLESVSLTAVDPVSGSITIDSAGDYFLDSEESSLLSRLRSNPRFAVWNNSQVAGISQRCFFEVDENDNLNEIVYQRRADVVGNLNLEDGGIGLEIGSMPVMRFDYQGRRSIPYPLPLIARAMRNPEKAIISAGNIYSLEEGKLWYGSSGDMLLRDSIEFQATVRDVCAFDVGVIAATERGLQFVSKNNYQSVYKGERIVPDYLATCSGGAIAVQGRKIYLIHKVVTDDGSWYPQATEIGRQISEVVFEGTLKSASMGNVVYLADDYNVWGYDLDMKVWSLKYNYDTKIHKLFVFNDKLGLSFDAQIDRRKSFDAPKTGVS